MRDGNGDIAVGDVDVNLGSADQLLTHEQLVVGVHLAEALIVGQRQHLRVYERHRSRGDHPEAEVVGHRDQLGAEPLQVGAQLLEGVADRRVALDDRLLQLGGELIREALEQVRAAGDELAGREVDDVELLFHAQPLGLIQARASTADGPQACGVGHQFLRSGRVRVLPNPGRRVIRQGFRHVNRNWRRHRPRVSRCLGRLRAAESPQRWRFGRARLAFPTPRIGLPAVSAIPRAEDPTRGPVRLRRPWTAPYRVPPDSTRSTALRSSAVRPSRVVI